MNDAAARPALFLDRDGVINVEKHYVHRREDFEFVDGIFELCAAYRDAGFRIVVVTNQSGIARGYYGEDDFAELSRWMRARFAEHGITVDGVYHCPHHPDITGACACRKPEPGMFLDAAHDLNLDLARSVMVGDSERDIVAARRAGVGHTFLYAPGGAPRPTQADRVIADLRDATVDNTGR